ncbi:MAG: hypothetical protein LQ346_003582 [Caloplaca aetnensis]|nr:MAG: hypothetical protein LQ346_003582 [Caloplaca aetnensis]
MPPFQSSQGSKSKIGAEADYYTESDPFGSPSPTRPPLPAQSSSSTDEAPPPAYARVDQSPIVTGTPSTNADSEYAFLPSFDIIFLIDDSDSMAGPSWGEVAGVLETIAPICTTVDSNGVDIYFLNKTDSPEYKHITSKDDVCRIFSSVEPRGGTPTGCRLNEILQLYLTRCERQGPESCKPINIIVITNGIPSDNVESSIISAAKKLDFLKAFAWQVGIQFFQVGEDKGAAQALRKLDDELAKTANIRDILDTVPWEGGYGLTPDKIMKCVLGAVNRRLDRKKLNVEDVVKQ